MTTIVTVGTAAAQSSQIDVADGSSATFSIVSLPGDRESSVRVDIVQESSLQTIGYLRAWPLVERSFNIAGPVSLLFTKGITASAAGVDQQ